MISQGGPMTRYVEDSALMLEIISGFSSEDPSSLNKPPIQFEDEFWEYSVKEYFQKEHSKKQLNIAWIDNFGSVTPNTEITTSCLNALSILENDGHTITPVKFELDEIFKSWFNIFSVGTYIGHEEDYKNNKKLNLFSFTSAFSTVSLDLNLSLSLVPLTTLLSST